MTWNRGVYLNGQNAYIEILNSEGLNFNELTIFFRCKLRQTRAWRYILSKATGAPFSIGWFGWRFNTGNDGAQLNFDLSESATNYIRLYGGSDIVDNDWHEILGWWDGNNAELWVDEELRDSGSFAGNIANDLPIVIGATSAYAANTQCIFDELLIWNRALTDTEKEQLWQGKIPQDGLKIWLPFNEGMGVVCRDRASGLYCRMVNCKWIAPKRRGIYFDNGGMKFASNVSLSCNYMTAVGVFRIWTLNKGGSPVTGRNAIIHLGGDKLMLFNNFIDDYLRATNYDGAWKELASTIDLEAGQVYVGVEVQNGNEEHVYVVSNGEIIDHNVRTDIGDAGTFTDKPVNVGSAGVWYQYPLHGEVIAVMVYNRPLTEDEIKKISEPEGWLDPPKDGLISWIVFDKKKEGDVVVDEMTNVQGINIGMPKFVVRKPLR